jgi:hypothetical protein
MMYDGRTLKRFSPDAPFERSSWSITEDLNLFRHAIFDFKPDQKISDSTHPKDLYLRICHRELTFSDLCAILSPAGL